MENQWGYIYEATTTSFIRRGWKKIGVTNNVKRRLKDLSSSSGNPEKFLCHNWYRFENLSEAKKVEQYIHKELTKLGLRVHQRREFFAYRRNFFIRDIVYEAAEYFGFKTLADTRLYYKDEGSELGLLLPCRFFLLSDDEVFDDFCSWGQRTLTTAISLLGYENTLFDSRIFRFLNRPDYPFREYLRDYDKEPYLLARMKYSHEEGIEKARNNLELHIEEELEDYFYYDCNWRARLGALREPDQNLGYVPTKFR